MSSGRIDIHGQRGFCDASSGIAVDRSMPAVLASRMMLSSWTTFCDRLDEALEPANKLKKCMLFYSIFAGSLAVAMIIFGFISFSSMDYDSASNGIVFFFVAFLLVFLGGFASVCFSAAATKKMTEGLRRVCDDASAMHPDISFHVRYEDRIWGHRRDTRVSTHNYIEVYVSNASNAAPVVQGYVAPSAPALSAVAVAEPEIDVEGGKKTPAERMGELDEMRGLLTEDEYQQKRAEILSDV